MTDLRPEPGLSAAQFGDLFPFHVVFDDTLRIVGLGRSFAQLTDDVRTGAQFDVVFRPRRPRLDWSFAALEARQKSLHILEHRGTGMVLRGEMLRLSGTRPLIGFFGSVTVDSLEQLEQLRLTRTAFAPHDATLDLLQALQMQRVANRELQDVSGRLERNRVALQDANASLQQRNGALAAAATELAEVHAIAGIGAWSYDPRADRMRCSPQLAALFGIDPAVAEVPSSALLARLAGRSKVMLARILRGDLSRGDSFDGYLKIRVDDEWRFGKLIGRAERTAAGNVERLRGTVQDITRRRRVDALVRQQRGRIRKLALVAAEADVGVVITDRDGRIEWANRDYLRVTGYDLKGLRGTPLAARLPADDTGGAARARLQEALRGGPAFSIEYQAQTRDGGTYWDSCVVKPVRDRTGRLVQLISMHRDVTQRRKAIDLLARRSAELDAILALSPDGFIAFDEHGAAVYANPAAASLLGTPLDKLANSTLESLGHMLRSTVEPTPAGVELRQFVDRVPNVLHVGAESATAVRCTVRSLRAPAGVSLGSLVHFHDVTDERARAARRRQELAFAAHELRNPLHSVHGFSDLLLQGGLDESVSREVIGTIQEQSRVIVHAVTDLLELEQLALGRSYKLLRQPVLPCIQAAVAAARDPADARDADVNVEAFAGIEARFDFTMLRRALANVVDNAFKYSRDTGGAVRIDLRRRETADREEVGIVVIDQGTGMTQAEASRAFDRFYRANPHGEVLGAGLGLALVREVLEGMGGSVELASKPGAGTTVVLWLPAERGA